MFGSLKQFAQKTFPSAVTAYRTLRENRAWKRVQESVTPEGFKLAAPSSMQDGSFEPEERSLIKEYIRKTDAFVDVGAHVGLYTCLSRFLGAHTISVEPLEENLRYLYRNIKLNGWSDVEVFPLGLSSRPGISTLYGGGTGASLIPGWAGSSTFYQRSISVSTLDVLLGDRWAGKQLFIKVDVEGSEWDLLQGSMRTLRSAPRPFWLVEICLSQHHPSGTNTRFVETFETFWQSGYEVRAAGSDRRLILPADVERWKKEGSCDPLQYNYLMLPRCQ